MDEQAAAPTLLDKPAEIANVARVNMLSIPFRLHQKQLIGNPDPPVNTTISRITVIALNLKPTPAKAFQHEFLERERIDRPQIGQLSAEAIHFADFLEYPPCRALTLPLSRIPPAEEPENWTPIGVHDHSRHQKQNSYSKR